MPSELRTSLPTLRRLVRRAEAFTRRHAFAMRVAAALAVSVVLLLVASDWFFSRALTRELVHQDARSYAADAAAVEVAYAEGSDPEDGMDDALDLVDSMEDRLGIVSARLLDANGKPLTAPRDWGRGADLRRVPKRNDPPSHEDVATREHGGHFEFTVPLEIEGDRFMLEVNQDGAVLSQRIDALRDETLLFSIIVLAICAAVFYVLGGRTLARRHRNVVKRATRDPLTDLGNHRSFQEELTRAIAFARRHGEALAVALVDLDEFKFLNDRYGHRKGDEVLTGVARALEGGRPEDRAFRIGGDEFALLMPGTDGDGARIAMSRRLDEARRLTGASLTTGVAVVLAGADTDHAVVWEQADTALYEAKRSARGAVVVFDEVAELLSVVTPAKIQALRSLLDEPRLEVAFQPIWNLQAERMIGLEALARPWAGYGFDGPAEMFEIAEKIGRAHELDAVCRSAALSHAHELPEGVLLFLNVNPQSLTHGALGGDRLVRAVTAAGLQPSDIVLEITERSDARIQHVVADAMRLRSLGFRLALDDVGAGNAGLEMLRDMPVDFVKIDRSVISAAVSETQAQAVLAAIVAFARRTNAFVIAEGIESEDILTFVRKTEAQELVRDPAIDGGQGYHLGRPTPDLSTLADSLRPDLAA